MVDSPVASRRVSSRDGHIVHAARNFGLIDSAPSQLAFTATALGRLEKYTDLVVRNLVLREKVVGDGRQKSLGGVTPDGKIHRANTEDTVNARESRRLGGIGDSLISNGETWGNCD